MTRISIGTTIRKDSGRRLTLSGSCVDKMSGRWLRTANKPRNIRSAARDKAVSNPWAMTKVRILPGGLDPTSRRVSPIPPSGFKSRPVAVRCRVMTLQGGRQTMEIMVGDKTKHGLLFVGCA